MRRVVRLGVLVPLRHFRSPKIPLFGSYFACVWCVKYQNSELKQNMSLELLLDAAIFLEQQEESIKGKLGCGGVVISGGGRYFTGQHRLCCKCVVCLQISEVLFIVMG